MKKINIINIAISITALLSIIIINLDHFVADDFREIEVDRHIIFTNDIILTVIFISSGLLLFGFPKTWIISLGLSKKERIIYNSIDCKGKISLFDKAEKKIHQSLTLLNIIVFSLLLIYNVVVFVIITK